MELKLLPPLVAGEINLLLGLFALVQAGAPAARRCFAGLAFVVALWCAGGVAYYLLPPGGREIGLRLSFAAGSAVPILYLAWSRHTLAAPLPRWVWTALAAAFLALNTAANLKPHRVPLGPMPALSAQALVLSAYMIAPYLIAFLSLRRTASGGPNARAVLYTAAVPLALMLPYSLAALRFNLPAPNVFIPVVIGAEAALYFMARTRQVVLDEVLSRGLLYLIYTVLITAFLFLGLFAASRVFIIHLDPSAFLLLVGLALLSAFAFVAGRDRLQGWIDRSLFPEKAEYERRIRAYEDDLASARERLRAAERLAMIGELAARVAHEIKNPLGPIKGYTQLLAAARSQGPVPDATLDRALAIIAEEVDKIDARVRRLLDLARREPPEPILIDLHQLLDKTIPLLESSPGLAILRDFQAASPLAKVDPAQLQAALFNVLQNAREAMNGQGEITISTRNHDRDILISILDTGPGIPPSDLPLIFEPFHSSRHGIGLGLAIARSSVEAIHGRLEAVSEPGKGAEFKFFIPAAKEAGNG